MLVYPCIAVVGGADGKSLEHMKRVQPCDNAIQIPGWIGTQRNNLKCIR